jgi:hypothetical protein
MGCKHPVLTGKDRMGRRVTREGFVWELKRLLRLNFQCMRSPSATRLHFCSLGVLCFLRNSPSRNQKSRPEELNLRSLFLGRQQFLIAANLCACGVSSNWNEPIAQAPTAERLQTTWLLLRKSFLSRSERRLSTQNIIVQTALRALGVVLPAAGR